MKKGNVTKSFNISQDDKQWFIVDAQDKVLGRLATNVAKILMGKHKPTFTKNYDTGDFVVIINAEKICVTGNKVNQKEYLRYTGYMGGQKKTTFKDMLKKHPDRIIIHAIKGMLPSSILGRHMLKKLKVYKGPDHKHNAQNPIPITNIYKEK